MNDMWAMIIVGISMIESIFGMPLTFTDRNKVSVRDRRIVLVAAFVIFFLNAAIIYKAVMLMGCTIYEYLFMILFVGAGFIFYFVGSANIITHSFILRLIIIIVVITSVVGLPVYSYFSYASRGDGFWRERATSGSVMERETCASYFGNHGNLDALYFLLLDNDPAVSRAAFDQIYRIGVKHSVNILIRHLNARGDLKMAQLFLNGGNKDLESAAKEWASARGFDIITINTTEASKKFGSRR